MVCVLVVFKSVNHFNSLHVHILAYCIPMLHRSGGNRYYSKNSTNNPVTLVGEFLLRQHMTRVWLPAAGDSVNSSKSMYDECGDYLQRHRLTLSFEVVTSVLGDHGDTPKKPYLIREYNSL